MYQVNENVRKYFRLLTQGHTWEQLLYKTFCYWFLFNLLERQIDRVGKERERERERSILLSLVYSQISKFTPQKQNPRTPTMLTVTQTHQPPAAASRDTLPRRKMRTRVAVTWISAPMWHVSIPESHNTCHHVPNHILPYITYQLYWNMFECHNYNTNVILITDYYTYSYTIFHSLIPVQNMWI